MMKKSFRRAFPRAPLFALVLAHAATSHAGLVDKIAAIVNADVILNSDVDRFERTISLRRELDPLFGFSAEMEGGKPTRAQILEFLVQERLIGAAFKVADSEVEQEIQTVQRSNRLSKDDLSEFLKSKGFNYDQYFELMRVGLQKRNLLDREIRSRVNISDDDVRNYYFNQVAKTSSTPLEYSISLIAINFKTYKNNRAAEQAAEDALRSIRQGEAFADVARRVSDDASASSGGDLGYLSSDQLAEPLKASVKKLQIGSLSDLIRAPAGFMIAKLADIRSAENQKLVEMKEQIREQLAKEEYKKQLFLWAERARNGAYVRVN
ncbi:MAG: peptidylprolyl isomerase [Deltaproteobacteria bacterium]|nr:peptidylprolyl isomerase [Deltaproteobacteria bacterium]